MIHNILLLQLFHSIDRLMDQCSKIIRKFIVISNVWQKIKIEGGGTLPVKSWNHGDDLTVAISVNKARLADKVSHPRRQWGDVPPAWGCCDPYTLTHCPQVSYNPPSYIILSYFSLGPLITMRALYITCTQKLCRVEKISRLRVISSPLS